MGRSVTPKYAVEVRCAGPVHITSVGWSVKDDGRATAANLERYCEGHNASLRPGGTNWHLTKAFGDGCRLVYARIVRNDGSRTVLAEWRAPAFQTF